jgi:hypothetical protein
METGAQLLYKFIMGYNIMNIEEMKKREENKNREIFNPTIPIVKMNEYARIAKEIDENIIKMAYEAGKEGKSFDQCLKELDNHLGKFTLPKY